MSDEKIRINIRTGTSYRRPEPMPVVQENFPIISIDITPVVFYSPTYDILDLIVRGSLNDNELKKDPSRKLNIQDRLATQNDLSEICPICHDKFELNSTVSVLDCKHIFHKNCIFEWGMYKPECPVCRTKIPVLETR